MYSGGAHVNRAIDGDVVAVEIIAGLSDDSGQLSQSCPPAEASSSSSSSSSSTSSAQIAAETCEATPEAVEGLAPSAVTVPQRGRVVGIVRRGTRTYAGSISSELILTSNDDADAAGGGNSHHHHHHHCLRMQSAGSYFIPMNCQRTVCV